MVKLEFYNPSGGMEAARAHAPRLKTLAGKRIGIVSNAQWQSHRTLPLLKAMIEEDFPGTEVLPVDAFPQGTAVIGNEDTAKLVKESGVDAVILGNAACGACSTACGRAAARLETLGIPTVTLTRRDFVGVMRNTVSGLGLAPDAAMVTFPIEMFLADSDLTELKNRKQEFYEGLTHWTSKVAKSGATEMLSVEAPTYEEALTKVNNLFITNKWGDGLPLWPATRERVNWILRGSALPRMHVIGKFPPRGGLATVEGCAIALAMAGGRPEYLPVLIAAVEAFLDPRTNSDMLQATSASVFPVVIVNGPIAKEIKLNSGFGCLGPDPDHPAGASIGRALRQMQQNLGGALPGTGTMATWGAMRYTNAVFAEDEEGLPQGWPTHASERHGYTRGINSLSVIFVTSLASIKRRGVGHETPEEDQIQGLHCIAGFLRTPHLQFLMGYENETPGLVMISRVVAQTLASLGWDKKKIREFLWENSKVPMAEFKLAGGPSWLKISKSEVVRNSMQLDPWPITAKPENIALVVAGGEHPSHAYWMQADNYKVVGRPIAIPATFETLLMEAEQHATEAMPV